MRYSKEHKQETHDRIVRKASVRLREKGAHGIGVADLMKEVGLTHGGFYAHFDSRDALVVEAFAYAMDRSVAHWRELTRDMPPEARLAAIADAYMSRQHRDDPGRGCAVPALGAEIAREGSKTRRAFAAKVEGLIDMLAEQFAGLPPAQARQQATTTLATMMGTLLLARIAGTGELSDDILAIGRAAVRGNGPGSVAPPATAKTKVTKAKPAKPRLAKSGSAKSGSAKPAARRGRVSGGKSSG